MLRFTTLGAQITLFLFTALAAIATYLPFLNFFAYTPAFAFIHRLSITLNIGDGTKTIQPIVFIAPILILKALWAYHKRFRIHSLLKSKALLLISILVAADSISFFTTSDRSASLNVLLPHLMNWGLFLASSIWIALVADLLERETVRKFGFKLLKIFSIALVAFTIFNAAISVSQFIDCSIPQLGCKTWNKIDELLPNKLLPVGHQKFSNKPVVIRAYGVFGDVNFNGMYSLFILLISGTILFLSVLLQNKKGYQLTKERKWLILTILAAFISFALNLSRSAMLGASVVGATIFFLLLLPAIKHYNLPDNFWNTTKKVSQKIIVAGTLIFSVGFFVPMNYTNLAGEPRSTTLSKQLFTYVLEMFHPEQLSTQGHASLLSSAITIGNQSPLFGKGMGTFGFEYEKNIAPGSGYTTDPHSTYGRLYAEQGVIGLSSYFGVIIIFWVSAIGQIKKFKDYLISAVAKGQRLSREEYLLLSSRLFFILLAFGIPYYSVATVSYYGFFLPMTWWWGNGDLVK